MQAKSGPSAKSPAALGGLLSLVLASAAAAQGAAPDTAYGWKRQVSGMLNLSQSYYDNWVKGGTDALTWEINLQGAENLEREKFSWENKAKIVYGITKLGDDASRKSSDEWNIETIYTRKLGTWVNPFVSALARSQFTAGYTYDDTGNGILNSEFFDPAYLFQTAGVGFTPFKEFKERLGFTLKETFSETHGYADDTESGNYEDFSIEYGLSSVTEYQRAIMENILASTRLEVFVNFEGVEDIDGRWESKITAKVNKWISMNLEFDMLYDIDQSESAQTREALSVGINFLAL